MKTKAYRIALLFNGNKTFDREVIAGIAGHLGGTRVAWDLFLEEDFRLRQVAEARVESDNILNALEKGKRNAAWQRLSNEERRDIQRLEKELIAIRVHDDYKKIRTAIDALNKATTKLAEMMMDSAVSEALEGKEMNQLESEGPKSPHPIAPAEVHER